MTDLPTASLSGPSVGVDLSLVSSSGPSVATEKVSGRLSATLAGTSSFGLGNGLVNVSQSVPFDTSFQTMKVQIALLFE